jgi:ketosteroid isomerase-like protein
MRTKDLQEEHGMQHVHQTQKHVDGVSDDVRREIAEIDQAFGAAVARGDFERAARETYTQDAMILPPGGNVVRGREEIIQFWRKAGEQMKLEAAELSTVELTKAGDFLNQVGRAVLVADGQKIHGKYVVIWKQEGGRWKWHVDIWNTND